MNKEKRETSGGGQVRGREESLVVKGRCFE